MTINSNLWPSQQLIWQLICAENVIFKVEISHLELLLAANGMPLLPIPVINTQLGIYHRHPVMLSLEQEP